MEIDRNAWERKKKGTVVKQINKCINENIIKIDK